MMVQHSIRNEAATVRMLFVCVAISYWLCGRMLYYTINLVITTSSFAKVLSFCRNPTMNLAFLIRLYRLFVRAIMMQMNKLTRSSSGPCGGVDDRVNLFTCIIMVRTQSYYLFLKEKLIISKTGLYHECGRFRVLPNLTKRKPLTR
jgi:hypothetical protein